MKKTIASLVTFGLVAATFIPFAAATPTLSSGNKYTWLVVCPSMQQFYYHCGSGGGFCTPTACFVDVE